MKLVVRVQYVGERARLLLREDLAAEYTKGLIDDLEYFGFPMPHEQKPIEKSGFMLCVWHAERDSDMHQIIQNAFVKAKAEAHHLLDRNIRYISLNEDGIMHTTSLANKPYKPKTYNKSADTYNVNSPNMKPYGKAPKYPTVISQARKAVTPLSQRIGPDSSGYGAGSSGHYNEYRSRDVDMPAAGERTPPASGSDSSAHVMDVTQQTLKQLSQSSAFQTLMQFSPTASTPIKTEPASPAELSSLLRQPAKSPAQSEIPNFQALLEKAGVKSASAQAFLSAQSSVPSLATTSIGASIASPPIATAPPIVPTSSPANALGTQLSLLMGISGPTSSVSSNCMADGSSLGVPRPASATPAPPPRVPAAHAATRELWDVRRQITALQARETSLVSELQHLGQPVAPTEGGSSNATDQRLKPLQDEIVALRDELNREKQARKVSEALLRAERLRRAEVESVMKDTTRECKQPFVVPALFDAFMKLGQMTGDALKDTHGSGSMAMEL
ncbi:hypothetical protein C8Q80DRAFT_787601 [Daedaleopsis nitida]|nr:hypothetical protein C8Q80DRAFT_787601 [Daedaleopsis nitida]